MALENTAIPIPSLHGKKVLLGASGSVAAIRVPRLVAGFEREGAEVRVITTTKAAHFINVEGQVSEDILFTDESEWSTWSKLSDPVVHIDLSKWADVFVVAPTSANTLAKLALGLCDNLLTSTAKAWPFEAETRKSLYVAPAMNTQMWRHPTTVSHLDALAEMGVNLIHPISKKLACGDVGVGAMQEPEAIVQIVADSFQPEGSVS